MSPPVPRSSAGFWAPRKYRFAPSAPRKAGRARRAPRASTVNVSSGSVTSAGTTHRGASSSRTVARSARAKARARAGVRERRGSRGIVPSRGARAPTPPREIRCGLGHVQPRARHEHARLGGGPDRVGRLAEQWDPRRHSGQRIADGVERLVERRLGSGEGQAGRVEIAGHDRVSPLHQGGASFQERSAGGQQQRHSRPDGKDEQYASDQQHGSDASPTARRPVGLKGGGLSGGDGAVGHTGHGTGAARGLEADYWWFAGREPEGHGQGLEVAGPEADEVAPLAPSLSADLLDELGGATGLLTGE